MKTQSAKITVKEARSMIGDSAVSLGGIYAAIHRGELDSVRLGRRILIDFQSFEKWLRGDRHQEAGAL